MVKISEAEFARIVAEIRDDRDVILKHNPIGPADEVLLWMLLSCLISYLSLSEQETPCFPGRPDAQTYRSAVVSVLSKRRIDDFDPDPYLSELTK